MYASRPSLQAQRPQTAETVPVMHCHLPNSHIHGALHFLKGGVDRVAALVVGKVVGVGARQVHPARVHNGLDLQKRGSGVGLGVSGRDPIQL